MKKIGGKRKGSKKGKRKSKNSGDSDSETGDPNTTIKGLLDKKIVEYVGYD